MYGLVNQAVQVLVEAQFGTDVWVRIRTAAGAPEAGFEPMTSYPDDLTYRMVGAASAELHLTPEQVLIAFGESWMAFTVRKGYGELYRVLGEDLLTLLGNLDRMHARLRQIFPHLSPPSLICSDATSTSVRLHYRSSRVGLAPFVVGLLQGMAKLYDTEVRITHDRRKAEGADHDEFLIEVLQLGGRVSF